MTTLANIIAISSLALYAIAVFSKRTGITLIFFGVGDFVYAISYIVLGDYLTASTFILGIFISILLGVISIKNKKTPVYMYVIFEICEVLSFVLFYDNLTDIIVLVANLVYVFFACYNDEKLLKYSVLFFGALFLIYNIINFFAVGIIIEAMILLMTITDIVKNRNTCIETCKK